MKREPATTNSASQVQPRSAIISLFGGWLVFMDNWIAIADLVALMETLNLEGPAVRAAVGRLKKRGLLEATTKEGIAGYSATTELQAVLDKGESRIFSTEVPADLSDGWVLAIFSVPESKREQRRQLRNQLTSLGFGPIASGVLMAPSRVEADAKDLMVRNGLDQYVHFFRSDHVGFGPITELVETAWDSEQLGLEYMRFNERNHKATELTVASATPNRQAFISCMQALEDWRPLSYRDPGLPDEIHAFAAERRMARKLFARVGDQLKMQADDFVKDSMRQYTNGRLTADQT